MIGTNALIAGSAKTCVVGSPGRLFPQSVGALGGVPSAFIEALSFHGSKVSRENAFFRN
jgi:hypothetical protein